MKLLFKALAAGVLFAAAASNANAITIQFSCTGDQNNTACAQSDSGGGTASAILSFTQTAPNTLQVVVNNTSPDFAPALLGFGFNVDPDDATFDSFTASAFTASDIANNTGPSADLTAFWTINQGSQGLIADFAADNGNGSQGGLFNPDVAGQSLGQNAFFTTAIFTINFVEPVSLVFDNVGLGSGLTGSTFVRFQRAGPNADGSTKIACSVNDPACTIDVPEPGVLGLLGGSLIGIGFLARRRRSAG